MENPVIIKTQPFLKFYKRKTDDQRQVIIRAKVYKTEFGRNQLINSFDIRVLNEDGDILRANISEFENRRSIDRLKYRIPEVELLIIKAIRRIINNKLLLNVDNIFTYTYKKSSDPDFDNSEFIFNEDIERVFGYPIPVSVWDELGHHDFIDEETGAKVPFDEFIDIAKTIESEFYEEEKEKEIEKMDFNLRYKNGYYDKNDIFECFGFCWSNHPTKNEPLICDSYKGLLLRLYDYRYNSNPPENIKFFDENWIKDFLIFLVQNGYAVIHPRNYNPFNLEKFKVELINAERKPYRFSAFNKLLKHLKRYINLLKKYNIIILNYDIDLFEAKDFIGRNVSTENYTRREHSLNSLEFEQLCSTDFNDKNLNIARDMFIIATLGGGLRGEEFFNDQLSIEKFKDKYVLHIFRTKTKTIEQNPIFGKFEEIINKNNGKLPYFLNEAQLRAALRKIANELNFDRIIFSPNTFLNEKGGMTKYIVKDIFSIYFARKTFVSFLDAAGMMDDDIIEFTSHSKTDTLKHYKGNLSLSNKFKLIEKFNLDI